MSASSKKGDGAARHRPDDDQIEALVRGAGSRPEVPAELLARIERKTLAYWQSQQRTEVDDRQTEQAPGRVLPFRRPAAWVAAAAAAAALVLSVLTLPLFDDAAPSAHAFVVAYQATTPSTWSVGARLEPGSRIATGAGERITLAIGETPDDVAFTLRLDQESALVLSATDPEADARLERGRLYFESTRATTDFALSTPLGRVFDVGTRYEARLLPDSGEAAAADTRSSPGSGASLVVRVREGAVRILELDEGPGRVDETAVAGESLAVTADGDTSRGTVTPWDDSWAWTRLAAPPFELEGATLGAFLSWAERESGLELDVSPDVASRAETIVLHGSVEGLSPSAAVEVVLPGVGLDARRDDGVLRIVAETGPGSR